jgi:predicted RNA-binding Zn ribbon-like protein
MSVNSVEQRGAGASRSTEMHRDGAVMSPASGDDAISAGLLCLEFVAVGRQLETATGDELSMEQRLTRWLARFGLPGPIGGLTNEDLVRARQLSAAINTTARSLMASLEPDAEHIRDLNDFAHHPTPVFLLRHDGRRRVAREENDAAASFSVVARDAINLFATADLRRLRACAGCDLLFYDRSPSGRRRWCSMKRCGERAASALYRQRHARHVLPSTPVEL